ncbi:MAG: TVP38/TMEM64 family protein [Corynebacterium sp.]|nr:TVP38/TMEM64 family protein [Corynebacterium sp.]
MTTDRPPSRLRLYLISVVDFAWGTLNAAIRSVRDWPWWKKLLITVALVAAVIITVGTDIPSLARLRSWADQTGSWFPLLFALAYIVITQLPIPRTLLTLSSGILFGPGLGILIALVATTISAAISLTIVRAGLGAWMAPRLNHPAIAPINARLKARGWLAITSLRMIAGVPFSILNYAAALTSVRLIPFVTATAVGSAPGTIALVILGDTLTGQADPRLLAVTVILLLVGLSGLLLDARLPVAANRQQ